MSGRAPSTMIREAVDALASRGRNLVRASGRLRVGWDKKGERTCFYGDLNRAVVTAPQLIIQMQQATLAPHLDAPATVRAQDGCRRWLRAKQIQPLAQYVAVRLLGQHEVEQAVGGVGVRSKVQIGTSRAEIQHFDKKVLARQGLAIEPQLDGCRWHVIDGVAEHLERRTDPAPRSGDFVDVACVPFIEHVN